MAPYEPTPGVLSLIVCAGDELTFRVQVRVANLPCNPPGSRHSFASLVSALEDRVFRSAGRECGVRLCGPAPALLFRPVVPTEAFRAPPFGSGCFWNGVAARGALWVCSFQWPDGSVLCGSTTAAASPTAPDRSASVAWPSGSGVLSGGLGGVATRELARIAPQPSSRCAWTRRLARQGCCV